MYSCLMLWVEWVKIFMNEVGLEWKQPGCWFVVYMTGRLVIGCHPFTWPRAHALSHTWQTHGCQNMCWRTHSVGEVQQRVLDSVGTFCFALFVYFHLHEACMLVILDAGLTGPPCGTTCNHSCHSRKVLFIVVHRCTTYIVLCRSQMYCISSTYALWQPYQVYLELVLPVTPTAPVTSWRLVLFRMQVTYSFLATK